MAVYKRGRWRVETTLPAIALLQTLANAAVRPAHRGSSEASASSSVSRVPRTPWGLVGLLVAAGMVAAFHVGKVPPSIPSIRAELGASLGQAGWLLSMVNLITALGGMAIALSADRFGHRRLVLLGTALCVAASGLGAFAGSVDALLVGRFFEGLGFIAVVVALPTLLLRIARPADQRLHHDAVDRLHAGGRRDDDADRRRDRARHVVARRLAGCRRRPRPSCSPRCCCAPGRAMSSIPCRSSAGRCCMKWPKSRAPADRSPSRSASAPTPAAGIRVIGFLPTLQVDHLGFSTSTAAIVTRAVTIVNVAGNLAAGWLMRHGLPRVVLIVGASLSMALCAAGIFVDGVPDLLRLVLAGVYSAVIGVVPAALFTALPVHTPRPELVGASTGPADAGLQYRRPAGPSHHRRAGRRGRLAGCRMAHLRRPGDRGRGRSLPALARKA